MDEKRYKMDDYGLLAGLISLPPKKDPQVFFEQEFQKNLSENYLGRRGISNGMSKKLYQYKGYRIFGDHNLAVLTLIDDFAYPTRSFHPAHGNHGDEKYHNYEYQVMTCLNTLNLSSDKPCRKTSLDSFFGEKVDKYSFICITRAKVNNSFLLGNGIDFIEEVKNKLYDLSESCDLAGEKGLTLILDNLGYEELIVLNFSNTLSSIAKYVYHLRCLLFKSSFDEEKQTFLLDRIIHFKNDGDKIKDFEEYKWDEAHIFSSVHALPGYNISLQEDSPLKQPYLKGEELKVEIDFTWEIKPGHTRNFRKKFKKEILAYAANDDPLDEDKLQLNNGLFVYTLPLTDSNYLQKASDVQNLEDFLHKVTRFDRERNHTRKLHMKMVICNKDNFLDKCTEIDEQNHPDIKPYIKKVLRIHSTDLNDLRLNMQKTNVSKLLRERIMKMFNNYNNSITDPLFFVNFIDLFGFMQRLLAIVKEYANGNDPRPLQEFQTWLNDNIGNFEQAYYNRFHQSSRMREMTDFNIEWNGGIQQILSPLDTIYKELLCYGVPQLDKFVQIIGDERSHVTDSTFRINILQITYPELFIAVIWKELFNFSWRKLLDNHPTNCFTKEGFSKYLKHYILRDNGFQENNAVHQLLADMIDKEFVNALIADTLSFGYGYNYNLDLYSYWYWKASFQGSSYRDKEQNLNSKYFIKFLARILFVTLVFEKEVSVSVEDLRLKPADPQIADIWITNFEDVLSFVRILKKILVDGLDYYKQFDEVIIGLYESDISVAPKKDQTFDAGNVWSERRSAFSELSDQYVKNFKNKQLSFPDKSHPKMFLVTFFYAFLQYMKDLDSYKTGGIRTRMLLRDKEGKPITDYMIENYSNILADPQGGLYCIKPAIMKDCFALRSTFYRSIFDFCMKKKKEHVEHIATQQKNSTL
ncbi:MAG: hypothetical protein LBS55_08230 [Prevotellaceae bacterium]|jgi:hypothetical protein|nr:hypothetical protein [Prevotellaceae bacterium]